MTLSQSRPVVIIVNSLYPGGAERLIIDDIHEMLRRHIDVRLITLKHEKAGATFSDDLRLSRDRWKVVPFRRVVDVRAWVTLIALLWKWRPYAVITHLWLANTVGRIAGRLAWVPRIIAFEHNVYDTIKQRRHFCIDAALAHLCTRVVAVSAAVQQSLIRHGISARNITIVRNAIPLGSPRDSKTEARRSLGYDDNDVVFVFVGRLIVQKGVDTLLHALTLVKASKLLIVGDGAERSRLEALAQTLGLSDRARFLGFQTPVATFFAAADCFVLPSRWEGLPVVILEAFAAGCPIIASNVDGTREVVQDGVNGILVEVNNVQHLANAMDTMVRNQKLRSDMAERNREYSNQFDITTHVDTLLKLLT